MTSDLVLNVIKREKIKQNKEGPLGAIPGILYGRGIENQMLWINRKEFSRVCEEAGESTIFKARLENGEERNVLIKEVQRDILNSKPIHVDLYQVRMYDKIETTVELEFVGESRAVKELGGVLVRNMTEIEVKCLPADLPSKIEVDISSLETFDDYVYVKNLPVSDKVEVLADSETVVAMVSPPRSEEELAELKTEIKEDVTQVEGVVKEKQSASTEIPTDASEEKKGGVGKVREEKGK